MFAFNLVARVLAAGAASILFASSFLAQFATTRVSVASDGTQGNSDSLHPSISADGRFVAFESRATNVVAGDTNRYTDIFLRDTVAGTTTRVSVATDGTQANRDCTGPSISADGRFVVFESDASTLVPGSFNGSDVFVRDTFAGTTTQLSVASDGTEGNGDSEDPSISADGRYVAYQSYASNLVPGDTNSLYDVFVRDTVAGTTTRVSVASDGTQANSYSYHPSISADGRYVAFDSFASNLVAGDTNAAYDTFVRDTVTGTTTRVSVTSDGTQAISASYYPSISADGRYVAFHSYASNLVSGDTNNSEDVFVRDTVAGTTTRLSVSSDGKQGNRKSDTISAPSISADGRYVAFGSFASNLVAGDTNGLYDVFVRDTVAGTTTRVSIASAGTQGNGYSRDPSVCADGRAVAFDSYASNLVPGDTNGSYDIFLRAHRNLTRVDGLGPPQ
jgi:Tol biopolymer transport system component